MTHVLEPEKRTRVRATVDVLVCGGGPAGVGAGLAAARSGASTLVLERYGCLGGCATSGMLNRLGPYHDQEKMVVGGIPLEILERLVDMDAAIMPRPAPWGGIDGPNANYWAPFDPEALKYLLDTLAGEAGLRVLFDTRVAGPILDAGRVGGVFIESKSGREAILANVVIDATGDADVAAAAGVPYELGRPADGLTQPVGLFSKEHHLDRDRAARFLAEQWEKVVQDAQRRGEAIPPAHLLGLWRRLRQPAEAGRDVLQRRPRTWNRRHGRGRDLPRLG